MENNQSASSVPTDASQNVSQTTASVIETERGGEPLQPQESALTTHSTTTMEEELAIAHVKRARKARQQAQKQKQLALVRFQKALKAKKEAMDALDQIKITAKINAETEAVITPPPSEEQLPNSSGTVVQENDSNDNKENIRALQPGRRKRWKQVGTRNATIDNQGQRRSKRARVIPAKALDFYKVLEEKKSQPKRQAKTPMQSTPRRYPPSSHVLVVAAQSTAREKSIPATTLQTNTPKQSTRYPPSSHALVVAQSTTKKKKSKPATTTKALSTATKKPTIKADSTTLEKRKSIVQPDKKEIWSFDGCTTKIATDISKAQSTALMNVLQQDHNNAATKVSLVLKEAIILAFDAHRSIDHGWINLSQIKDFCCNRLKNRNEAWANETIPRAVETMLQLGYIFKGTSRERRAEYKLTMEFKRRRSTAFAQALGRIQEGDALTTMAKPQKPSVVPGSKVLEVEVVYVETCKQEGPAVVHD